jgi:hypothetical protein
MKFLAGCRFGAIFLVHLNTLCNSDTEELLFGPGIKDALRSIESRFATVDRSCSI